MFGDVARFQDDPHWNDPLFYEYFDGDTGMGLGLALCGVSNTGHDIGGFEGTPDPGVFKRWLAFGLLSSHSRLHGSNSYRVPWAFDDEAWK